MRLSSGSFMVRSALMAHPIYFTGAARSVSPLRPIAESVTIRVMAVRKPTVIRRDLEKRYPGRPLRILHLNRAIVATRTHRPHIMEKAFSRLIRDLAKGAPGFLSQAWNRWTC
jgi:hypothetical protein